MSNTTVVFVVVVNTTSYVFEPLEPTLAAFLIFYYLSY